MTKAQFYHFLLTEFFSWTSPSERDLESWLYSLQDWARMRQAIEREKREDA